MYCAAHIHAYLASVLPLVSVCAPPKKVPTDCNAGRGWKYHSLCSAEPWHEGRPSSERVWRGQGDGSREG